MNITEKFLVKNEWTRPGRKVKKVKALIIHWVSKPGQSAMGVWNYWNNDAPVSQRYCGGHYIVNLNGDVLHCIPNNEMAYHVGSRSYTSYALKTLSSYPNNCTLAIELCHQDPEGSFTDATFDSAVELCADLCKKYNLHPFENILTHKMVVGWKKCPLWFYSFPSDFEGFRLKVKKRM